MDTTIDHLLALLRSPDSNNRELGLSLMRSQGLQQEVVARVFPPGDFVWVEGGHFEMGSADGEADEKPVHTVSLSGFYIQHAPVTQGQYRLVMGKKMGYFQGCSDLPVENVNWYNAIEFCNRLSEMVGLEPYYTLDKDCKDATNINEHDDFKWTVTCNESANGYRLPTEAEWEYAAKGGVQSKGYLYAGSNDLDEVAWWKRNSDYKTHPVKQKKPNELGFYDMSGNVFEWCWDWYGAYNSHAITNPQGANAGEYRVLRGGSWRSDSAQHCRSACRSYGSSYFASYHYGFRLVRSR